MKKCTGLFDHALENLELVEITKKTIKNRCPKCGYTETLPRSGANILFMNTSVFQKKKWAGEDNMKELIQPINPDGSVNDDFTDVYGYNPFDKRTKASTPKFQGGELEI